MITRLPVQKLGASLHPAYMTALQNERRETGQSFGIIIERALHKVLKVKSPPGLRMKRGRKRKPGPRPRGKARKRKRENAPFHSDPVLY